MQQQKLTILVLLILLLWQTPSNGESNISNFKTYLTTDSKVKLDIGSFDCKDKIYITIDFQKISSEKHSIKAIWINPSNSTEQIATHDFQTSSGKYFGWLWLKLNPPTGSAILGDLSPNNGMSDFIGFWNVYLYLDDEKIDYKTFQVTC